VQLAQRGVVGGATQYLELAGGVKACQQQLVAGGVGQFLDPGRED
jgi:hypothetical protein